MKEDILFCFVSCYEYQIHKYAVACEWCYRLYADKKSRAHGQEKMAHNASLQLFCHLGMFLGLRECEIEVLFKARFQQLIGLHLTAALVCRHNKNI